MKLQLEILPKEQLELYPHLKTITDMDFTLFGGTAIALQLGHRVSIDFDFFTDKDISHLHTKLLNLKNIKIAQITQQSNNTLVFTTHNGVKLSFFGTLEFVKLAGKIYSENKILKLADLTALLTTKLKATCDRAEYKDYIDIITILKTNQVSLEEGLRQIKNYFGNEFPLINIVKGLTYFKDGDLHRLSKEDKEFLYEKVNKLDFRKIESQNHTQNKNQNSYNYTKKESSSLEESISKLDEAIKEQSARVSKPKPNYEEQKNIEQHNENLENSNKENSNQNTIKRKNK